MSPAQTGTSTGPVTGPDARPCLHLWGKHPERQPYPLLGHLIDTTVTAGAVWDTWLRPGLRLHLIDALAPGNPGRARSIVQFLAGIHDIGKANAIFALQETDQRPLSWREPFAETLEALGLPRVDLATVAAAEASYASAARRHEYVGMVGLLGENPNPEDGRLLRTSWPAIVTGGHHGRWQVADTDAQTCLTLATGPWLDQQRAHLEAIEEVTGISYDALGPLTRAATSTIVLLTGIVILADWLASHPEVVDTGKRLHRTGTPLDERWASARHTQVAALTRTLIGSYVPPADPTATILGTHSPRPLQVDAITRVTDKPGLWIVAYPTGEGKTEAALLRHAARRDEGLLFALPTRATTDAMTSRLRNIFTGTGNLVVKSHEFAAADDVAPEHASTRQHAQPHRSTRPGARQPLVDPEDPDVTIEGDESWGEDSILDAALDAGHDGCCDSKTGPGGYSIDWFNTSIRRLVAPVAAMTCDQVLAGSLRQKHAPLRLLALANHHVVIDEVHTFDHYQVELLIEMLSWLGSTGARVTLLSATMPLWMQRRLAAAYTGLADGKRLVPDADYPSHRIVTASDHAETRAPSTARPTSLGLDLKTSDNPAADHADWAITAAADHPDCHIAVIVNTVARAADVALFLRAALPDEDVLCLHSRMTQGHRAEVEETLLARTGPDSPPGQRLIVVATQVAEASLDVDFDLMSTDLAPSASLVQRAGRLWRFHHAAARAVRHSTSLTPPTRTLRVVTPTEDGSLTLVAALPYLSAELKRVAEGLTERTRLVIPDDVQDFVDETTLDLEGFYALGDKSADASREHSEIANRIAAALDSKAHLRETIVSPRRHRYAALIDLTSREDTEETMMTRFVEEPGHSYLLIDPDHARPDIAWAAHLNVPALANANATQVRRLLRHVVPVSASALDRHLFDRHVATLAAAGLGEWTPDSGMLRGLLPLDVNLIAEYGDYHPLVGLIKTF